MKAEIEKSASTYVQAYPLPGDCYDLCILTDSPPVRVISETGAYEILEVKGALYSRERGKDTLLALSMEVRKTFVTEVCPIFQKVDVQDGDRYDYSPKEDKRIICEGGENRAFFVGEDLYIGIDGKDGPPPRLHKADAGVLDTFCVVVVEQKPATEPEKPKGWVSPLGKPSPPLNTPLLISVFGKVEYVELVEYSSEHSSSSWRGWVTLDRREEQYEMGEVDYWCYLPEVKKVPIDP